MSTQTKDTLTLQIQAGRISDAVALVTSPSNYHDSEEMIFAVLNVENCPQEVIDAALERFVATRENSSPKHGYWVHSLSHFSDKLWERGMKGWIKRLNEISFKGANELGDTNCSDRLVGDLAREFTPWDMVPEDYGYTEENLRWVCKTEYNAYVLALLKALPFASEADFIKFELARPERFKKFDYEAQKGLVDGEKVQKALDRLTELGTDPTEFAGLLECMLRASLQKFETELKEAKQDWQIERATKAIEKTQAMLEAAQQ